MLERREVSDTGTIDGRKLILMDCWLGAYADPSFGIDALRTGNNTDANAFAPGAKIHINWTRGPSTFVYLQVRAQHPDIPIEAKSLVVDAAMSGPWYSATNDATSKIHKFSAVALAIGPVADDYYGWFWCGGYCPDEHIPSLAGEYVTAGPVVPGLLVALGLPSGIVAMGSGHEEERASVGFMFTKEQSC